MIGFLDIEDHPQQRSQGVAPKAVDPCAVGDVLVVHLVLVLVILQ